MRLDKLLGIEFPFIQGGMANIATGEFAAAVSNAGGLGLIATGGMTLDTFREHIHTCRSLTDKPYGVNIMLMHPEADAMAALARRGKGAGSDHRSGKSRKIHPDVERSGMSGDAGRTGVQPWPSAWFRPAPTPSFPKAPRAAAMWGR